MGGRWPLRHLRSIPNYILDKPTWSVRSLLPAAHPTLEPSSELSEAQVQHLVQLSALRVPQEGHRTMASILRSQLHFVRDIQKVDTAAVAPLQSIRDETTDGLLECTIGLERLRAGLSREILSGHNKRPKRITQRAGHTGKPNWDALQHAGEKADRYFVVTGPRV